MLKQKGIYPVTIASQKLPSVQALFSQPIAMMTKPTFHHFSIPYTAEQWLKVKFEGTFIRINYVSPSDFQRVFFSFTFWITVFQNDLSWKMSKCNRYYHYLRILSSLGLYSILDYFKLDYSCF